MHVKHYSTTGRYDWHTYPNNSVFLRKQNLDPAQNDEKKNLCGGSFF